MNADVADLIGTWSFTVENEIQDAALLRFSETDRVLQYIFSSTDAKIKPMPMRLLYLVESPGLMRLRPRPGHEGWTRDFKFEDGKLILSDGKQHFVCTRVAQADVPEWFKQTLADFLSQPI